MSEQLFVLVDYDNLGDFRFGKSVDSVVRHLVARVPLNFCEGVARFEVRLYGGWVTGSMLTRQAQTLSSEVQANFPSTTQRTNKSGDLTTSILSASLAQAGLFLPTEQLNDTLMLGRSLGTIRVDQSAWRPCARPSSCPLAVVDDFIRHAQCQIGGCGVTVRDLLRRNEQKQVDTLIVADMAHLVHKLGAPRLVLVSSDADMWPGVLMCLSAGALVCQIHTTPGFSTKPALRRNISALAAGYMETSI